MWARRPYEKSSSNERMNASERASLKIAENSQFTKSKNEFEFTDEILIIFGAKIQTATYDVDWKEICSENSDKAQKLND